MRHPKRDYHCDRMSGYRHRLLNFPKKRPAYDTTLAERREKLWAGVYQSRRERNYPL